MKIALINGEPYATNLIWRVLSAGQRPIDEARALKFRQAVIIPGKRQTVVGFGEDALSGKLSLAALLASVRKPSFACVFETDDGEYWVFAVVESKVLPHGDVIFARHQDASAWINQIIALTPNITVTAPAEVAQALEWPVGSSSFVDHKSLNEFIKDHKLKPSSAMRVAGINRVNAYVIPALAVTILMSIGGGAYWYYSQPEVVPKLSPEEVAALTAQMRASEKTVMSKNLSVEGCMEVFENRIKPVLYQSSVSMPTSWVAAGMEFDLESGVVHKTWKANKGASVIDLKRFAQNANLDAAKTQATETVELKKAVDIEPDDSRLNALLMAADAEDRLIGEAQYYQLGWAITGTQPVTLPPAYIKRGVQFKPSYASFIYTLNGRDLNDLLLAIRGMNAVPGTHIKTIKFTLASGFMDSWAIDGVTYVK